MTEQAAACPAPSAYEELAGALSLWLLRPALTEDALRAACREAARMRLGAVLVFPEDVEAASRALEGSGVAVASAAGYPHGAAATAVKLYEARDLLRRGVREIVFVLSTAKLLRREFQHVETELMQIGRSCLEQGARLHAVVESGYLAEDLRVIATKICKRCDAAVLSISNGLPPEPDWPVALGQFRRIAREELELGLMRQEAPLGAVLDAWAQGARRFACGNAAALAAAWKARLEAQAESGQGAG
jgi:deoxyribose-phosphate aldolase